MIVGNKSVIGSIDINEVLINDGAVPERVKIQVSSPAKGFIVTDRFDETEEKDYSFKDLNEVTIPTGTSPQAQTAKENKGKVTDADHTYALTIGDKQTIESVTIKYNHLGISHKTTVTTIKVQ
ncbi:hypothetical protein AB4Z45_17640 [Paenibacillus sp. MCAF9]|uniref:hypothetical protein n=1 Tax=Paenibacillus sp. MCAF9 TaxID=3233046 RepID=UPI003F9444B1